MNKDKVTLKETLKSSETEEWLDLVFYRKIGYIWALLFRRIGVTPNAVTIASIFIGIAGGVLFYFDNLYYNIVGMFLIVWANSFDSADGQLARMTGNHTRIGRILDGLSGDLWFITIYFALTWRLRDFNGWSWFEAYPLAALAGYCHIIQAQIADCYRNLHLLFVNGRAKSELDDIAELIEENSSLRWRKDAIKKILLFFYINYTRTQRAFSPAMRQMLSDYNRIFPAADLPKNISLEFITQSRPLVKYTNILTFNTRIFVLFISLLINQVWLYFAFELTIMNILLVYMILKYEKVCRRFSVTLNKVG